MTELTAKEKARVRALKRLYGISMEQYHELLERQGGGCAICGKTPEEEGCNLAVDHDHKTFEIRGVCCRYCNHRVVGRHRDPELLRRIADYIEKGTGWFVPPKPKKKRTRRSRKVKHGQDS